MKNRVDVRLKRLLILSLGIAGIVGLFARALGGVPSWTALWRRISFYSSSARPERIARSPYFGQDPAFARSLLGADEAWPRNRDVVLEVGPGAPPDWAEDVRRRAAYLLAPRRVRIRASSEPGVKILLGEPWR
jgi:hypothetical protein